MGYTEFENGITPLSEEVLNSMQTNLMMLVFPIGSIYITQDAEINPNSILRFGTWERLKGIIPIGVNEDNEDFSEIGKTGGNYEQTLTMYNLPPEAVVRTQFPNNVANNDVSQINSWNNHALQDGEMATIKPAPISIVQPYEVTGYYWIRRA